jgi:hypothetical protein
LTGGNAIAGGVQSQYASTTGYDATAENNYGLGSGYRSPEQIGRDQVAAQASQPSIWVWLVFGAGIAALVFL